MLYKLKDHLRRRFFARRVRYLLETPPIKLADDSAPLVLSQLQHKDVLMYLAAIKSFAGRVPVSGVHVVDDGSLTEDDRQLLENHVPGICFKSLEECRDKDLPVGGTWERLIAIARLSESTYVIQLDADTLSLGALDEVVEACMDNRSFSIGTWDRQVIESASETAPRARRALSSASHHVQMLAEAQLDQLQGAMQLRYVRGCSGFAGFSRGGEKIQLMRELSAQLGARLGKTWNNWGSEQVMSNLVVANQPGALVLPHPDYTDCEKMQPGKTRFIHFIGTCRFRGGRYGDMIRSLQW